VFDCFPFFATPSDGQSFVAGKERSGKQPGAQHHSENENAPFHIARLSSFEGTARMASRLTTDIMADGQVISNYPLNFQELRGP
jgi:hypothetical protein